MVFITIIGIEAFQFFAKYFNLKIFQTSFNEGVSNNVLEISSSKKNMKIQENTNLVSHTILNLKIYILLNLYLKIKMR